MMTTSTLSAFDLALVKREVAGNIKADAAASNAAHAIQDAGAQKAFDLISAAFADKITGEKISIFIDKMNMDSFQAIQMQIGYANDTPSLFRKIAITFNRDSIDVGNNLCSFTARNTTSGNNEKAVFFHDFFQLLGFGRYVENAAPAQLAALLNKNDDRWYGNGNHPLLPQHCINDPTTRRATLYTPLSHLLDVLGVDKGDFLHQVNEARAAAAEEFWVNKATLFGMVHSPVRASAKKYPAAGSPSHPCYKC